jgi:hypothetical protein
MPVYHFVPATPSPHRLQLQASGRAELSDTNFELESMSQTLPQQDEQAGPDGTRCCLGIQVRSTVHMRIYSLLTAA